MAESAGRQWRVRKVVRGDGVNINVAADVNLVTSEGGRASKSQRTRIVQSTRAAAAGSQEQPGSREEHDQ